MKLIFFIVAIVTLIWWAYNSHTKCSKCKKKAVFPSEYDMEFDKTVFVCENCNNKTIIP